MDRGQIPMPMDQAHDRGDNDRDADYRSSRQILTSMRIEWVPTGGGICGGADLT